jgi:hypothetical protein
MKPHALRYGHGIISPLIDAIGPAILIEYGACLTRSLLKKSEARARQEKSGRFTPSARPFAALRPRLGGRF